MVLRLQKGLYVRSESDRTIVVVRRGRAENPQLTNSIEVLYVHTTGKVEGGTGGVEGGGGGQREQNFVLMRFFI